MTWLGRHVRPTCGGYPRPRPIGWLTAAGLVRAHAVNTVAPERPAAEIAALLERDDLPSFGERRFEP